MSYVFPSPPRSPNGGMVGAVRCGKRPVCAGSRAGSAMDFYPVLPGRMAACYPCSQIDSPCKMRRT